jgi:hypothetical protein
MSPIITQPCVPAQVHPDDAARQRQDRLARATAGQAEAALAYLSAIDPLMFEIAMDAGDPFAGATEDALEDEEPVPVCRRCGAQVGIFLNHGLDWKHFRGDGTTSGAQQIYDPGHAAELTWCLPSEGPEEP